MLERTYRYRLYPTKAQVAEFERQLTNGCDLYNAALEQRRTAWKDRGVSVGYHEQSAELRELRAAGLLSTDSNFWSQQEILRRLDRGFQAFFRRIKAGEAPGYPRFKSKSRCGTLVWSFVGNAGGCKLRDDGRLALQGIGSVKVKWHREIPANSKLKQVRVTRSCGRFYASFALELEIPEPLPRTGEMVGLDVGITHFARLSTDESVPSLRAGREQSRQTRRASRRVARRRKGSNRRGKAVALLARAREREANRRRDHRHKQVHSLIKRFDLIAVEDLAVRRMVRSAKGTLDEPGTRVAQKTGLNREIHDQGWAAFIESLDSKAEEAGRRIVRVHPAGTSQTCNECGHRDKNSRRGERFCCTACEHNTHADTNAARNILARALNSNKQTRPGRGRQALTMSEETRVA